MKKETLAVAMIGVLGTAGALAACGGSDKSGSSSAAENTFVLSEFTVVPPTNALHPGRVTITADNVGGEMHELVIVRADRAGALPKKSDGSVDEDKIAKTDKVGEIEDVAAQSRKSESFDLAAGTYVALCNIVDDMTGSGSHNDPGMGHGSDAGSATGHVHFAERMWVAFTVS